MQGWDSGTFGWPVLGMRDKALKSLLTETDCAATRPWKSWAPVWPTMTAEADLKPENVPSAAGCDRRGGGG
jgi:hypothetical protein